MGFRSMLLLSTQDQRLHALNGHVMGRCGSGRCLILLPRTVGAWN